MSIDLTPHKASRNLAVRMLVCLFKQRSRTRACPDRPRLEGKCALVTGGQAGIGEFVSRGFLERGAQVVSLSRGVSEGTGKVGGLESVRCDLADPDTISEAVDHLADRKVDIVICNSGIVMREPQVTNSGVEKTFAVNVLGHHVLYRLLMERGLLVEPARVVITTGDAYMSARDCDPRPTEFNTMRAYAGSKLGNLWQVSELTKRYPGVRASAVHPGVVMSGLVGGSTSGFSHWLQSRLLVSEHEGAQAALIAATQDLPNGAYWHNVSGIMDLPPRDPGGDARKAAALWDELEELAAPWLGLA